MEHTSSCCVQRTKYVQTTSWNKYKFLPSYIKQYWMGTDMEARDDVMLVIFFNSFTTLSFSNSCWMIFECCFYGDRWTLFTCQRSLYVTMCLVRRGLNTEKLYWGRILYYAGHTCACCHHTVPVQSLQFLWGCTLHSPSCLLMPSIPPNFSATSYSLSQTNPQLYLTPQSGKLALRMEYKWHHYVIFNLLLQQYPIPQIAPFTTRPICSGLAGPVLFMENIKELLN